MTARSVILTSGGDLNVYDGEVLVSSVTAQRPSASRPRGLPPKLSTLFTVNNQRNEKLLFKNSISFNLINNFSHWNVIFLCLFLNWLKQFETMKQFYFHKTWCRIIYKLHWNIIHKSTGATWNVGPYKLIRLLGHPNLNLNLTQLNTISIKQSQ